MSIYRVEGGVHKKIKTLYDVQNAVNTKIQKGYYVLGGVHKKIYELSTGPVVTYSGTHSLSDVTVDGVDYTLLTCTKTGTLYSDVSLRYWMCGGGAKGANPSTGYGGGGGAGGLTKTGTVAAGQHTVTIGSGNSGTTKIGSTSVAGGSAGSNMDGGNGASGGGAAATINYDQDTGTYYTKYGTPGTGKGTSTYPFGLSSLYAHSPGGGAGATKSALTSSYRGGGNGGSNGSAGKTNTSTNVKTGGTGGTRGGGKGGDVTSSAGSNGGNGSFYGAGGGGSGRINSSATLAGGSGYQGVVYFLLPKNVLFVAA